MDLTLLFTLSLCWWTASARSYWSDKPSLIIGDEIKDGETAEITCTLPIDYGGGECHLYRYRGSPSSFPFRTVKESGYLCTFYLSSKELLGKRPVGSRVHFTCNYHLQQYRSIHSDSHGITVTGTCPSPHLSVSRRFLTPDESVEVTCNPPPGPVYRCTFYKDDYPVVRGPCSRNLTGQQLVLFWEKPALLHPVNLTCSYYPQPRLEVRSERSNHHQLLVIDLSQASTSMTCNVTVEDNQLEAFGDGSWTSLGMNGQRVTVMVTNRNMTTIEICEKAQIKPT